MAALLPPITNYKPDAKSFRPNFASETSILGRYNGKDEIKYIVRISEITSGLVIGVKKIGTGFVGGTTLGVYTNITTQAITGTGTGLTLDCEVKAAADPDWTMGSSSGAGYVVGDTVKVLGTAIGGATTANDYIITVIETVSSDIKLEYRTITSSTVGGWVTLDGYANIGTGNPNTLSNGISIAFTNFNSYSLGTEFHFTMKNNATSCQAMYVFKSKDSAHLVKYNQGALVVHYDINKATGVNQSFNSSPRDENIAEVGILAKEDLGATFDTINSKSIAVGLGPEKANKPKWVGFPRYKQFNTELIEDNLYIEDSELKIPSSIPILDDMVEIDTSLWYDSSDNKAGVNTVWSGKYYIGFRTGYPHLYAFAIEHNSLSGPTFLHKAYTRFSSGQTGITNPIAIATDGAHLFVLDKIGNGLIHCFQFTGLNNTGDVDLPTIDKLTKYNDTWPMVLPDTLRGICSRKNSPEVKGGGAWFVDMKVTPTDGRYQSVDGDGKLWLQAGWKFDGKRDYATYISEEFNASNDGDEEFTAEGEAWYPPICGENAENEWLWSMDITKPAHKTLMTGSFDASNRVLLVNRSPSLRNFYKSGKAEIITDINTLAVATHTMILRGDYDLQTTGMQSDLGDPNYDTSTNSRLMYQTSMAQRIGENEAGVLQTFKWGLVDMGEDKKIGVCAIYSGSDKGIFGNESLHTQGPLEMKGGHLLHSGQLWAEIATSGAFYSMDYIVGGSLYYDRVRPISGATTHEIEAVGIPASQIVTLSIIDGTVDGYTAKPLIIPLSEDILIGGYNGIDVDSVSANEFETWGAAEATPWGTNGKIHGLDRKLVNADNNCSSFRKAVYNSTNRKLTTFDENGRVRTFALQKLYEADSRETSSGANSWNKSEFLRKNPFSDANDYTASGGLAGGASNLMPGDYAINGASTGLIQHPRAAGMNFPLDDKRWCVRDATAAGSALYTSITTATDDNDRADIYGGPNGIIRPFLLPHELPEDLDATITHDESNATAMWDFLPCGFNAGGSLIVLNQRTSEISSILETDIRAGVVPTSGTVGFVSSVPFIAITGNGVGSPDDDDARVSPVHGVGLSRFVGDWKKDTPPDGDGSAGSGTDYIFDIDGTTAAPATVESAAKDYIYYSFSCLYDGYQESPLSGDLGSSVDTDSGWSVQVTGDSLNVEITIPDIRTLSKRISHFNVYRSKSIQDKALPSAFYQLVESISVSDTRWSPTVAGSFEWKISFLDKGSGSETYETRTGVSELLKDTQPHYGISTTGDGYLFVSQAWHPQITEADNYIFRSKAGKYNLFDWPTDWLELPESPTALSYLNGKLYAFSKNTTYIINPRSMHIEEDILQSGCLDQNSIVSCDYGMFWCDNKSIWLHRGTGGFQNIGLPIEIGDGDYAYRNRDKTAKVQVEFDSLTKCFLVFMKPRKKFNSNSSHITEDWEVGKQGVCWAYHIEKQRWDYWLLETSLDINSSNYYGAKTLATCRDWEGGVLYANENGLYRLGSHSSQRKDWSWVSKNFVMGYPTLEKRFYKIRAVSQNGTPTIQYKVDNAAIGLGVGSDEKIITKKGKRIQLRVNAPGTTAVDSIGIIYRKPKAK